MKLFFILGNQLFPIKYLDRSNLKKEELILTSKIENMDNKNTLLSTNLDLDYIETLIRERFLFGKKDETIYIIKNDEK